MPEKKPQLISTPVTEMLGIDFPVIAAPMFLVSNKEMVIQASESGGMGTFPALNFRPIEKYRQAIVDIKKQTGRPFGINIIVQKSNKHQQRQIEIALEEEVPLIITSLGSPRQILKMCQGTKTKVICDVVGLEHGKKVADLGAHGLVAVGSGAGGHGGDNSLFALLPHLKAELGLPLIAAGCIGDGRGLLAARALGADGVYMGTRMIATHEAQVLDRYKQAIIDADYEDIVNTDRVDGFPGNFIRTPELEPVLKEGWVEKVLSQNKKVKRWVSLYRAGKSLLGTPEDNPDEMSGKKSGRSPKKTKVSYKSVFSAGQGVANIHQLKSIREVVWQTAHEYHQAVAALSRKDSVS